MKFSNRNDKVKISIAYSIDSDQIVNNEILGNSPLFKKLTSVR